MYIAVFLTTYFDLKKFRSVDQIFWKLVAVCNKTEGEI